MEPKEEELLGLLHQLIDECRTFEDSEQWVRWFEKDRKELESSLEAKDDAKLLAVLAILDTIREAAQQGRSLAVRDFRKAAPAFHNTACRRLGSWPQAVQAAGLASRMPIPPRHWTREELIVLLRGYAHNLFNLTRKAFSRGRQCHPRGNASALCSGNCVQSRVAKMTYGGGPLPCHN